MSKGKGRKKGKFQGGRKRHKIQQANSISTVSNFFEENKTSNIRKDQTDKSSFSNTNGIRFPTKFKVTNTILWFVAFVITTLFGEKGILMLGSVPPKVAFALVLFVFCILVVWGYFTIASWFPKNWLFNTKKKKIISALTIVIFILAFPTTYSFINWFIQDVGSIVMDDYGDRSNVFVHYGERSIEKEVFSTNTTINKLESKPQFPLSVNGEHILTIHIKNDKVYFNARLFGGYKKQAFINLSLARTNDFLINLSGYLRTDILGATILQSPMGYITDNITVNKIADAILSPPILLEDKSTIPSELPKGWKKYRRATAIEIRNEYNIPVYIHEYKNPYEMTVSGIFYTSFGILKIDNSEDVTFQFGSNLGELGTYTVNNIFVHSFADLFISEKQYNLYKNYYNEGFINKAISFLEHLLAIPDKNIRNLVIKPTYFPATYSTPNGLLVEFSRRKDDIDPISVSVNVSGSRVDTQYAWWAKPNLTGFNFDEVVSFRKGVQKDAFEASSSINPPIFTYYSLGKPLSSSNSLYFWFVSDKPLNLESVVFQGAYFYRKGNELILDRSKLP